jgi:hypothetical protein
VSDSPLTFTEGVTMTFGIKYSMDNTITAGKFNRTGLIYLGRLDGAKELRWANVMLMPGMYYIYTNGSNEIFLFPEG